MKRNRTEAAGSSGLLVLLLVLPCLIVGCGKPIQYRVDYAPPSQFLLGPEDVLIVTVWRNEDLAREAVIRPDGKISMPLIGDVHASGLTVDELAKVLTDRYRELKPDAVVSVQVKEINSHFVFVLGEVTKPGRYKLKSHTTVLQAIAIAGGFTPYASENSMHVLRYGPNGHDGPHELRIPVQYDDLVSGEGEPGNFYVRSGDTIVVP